MTVIYSPGSTMSKHRNPTIQILMMTALSWIMDLAQQVLQTVMMM